MKKDDFVNFISKVTRTKDSSFRMSNKKHEEGELVKAVSMRVGMVYVTPKKEAEFKNVIIRRVIEKGNDLILDALDEGVYEPRLFYASKIIKIKDYANDKNYDNPYDFLVRHIGIAGKKKLADKELNPIFSKIIEKMRYEITALVFLANIDGDYAEAEKDAIMEYIDRRCKGVEYDKVKLRQYLSRLTPDIASFKDAINGIASSQGVVIKMFTEQFIKMIYADGNVDGNEKTALKKLIASMREEGINIAIPV